VALSTRETTWRTGAAPAATTAPDGNIAGDLERRGARVSAARRGWAEEETGDNYCGAGGAVIIAERGFSVSDSRCLFPFRRGPGGGRLCGSTKWRSDDLS
jgi:hypothetical protein